MPRQECRVCVHGDREKIELSLLAGWSYAQIAGKFGGVSASSVGRHARSHGKDYVVSERGELIEQVVAISKKNLEEQVMPELCRLTRETHPNATLFRALANIGLGSPGQRLLAVDALTKALVRAEAWGSAGALLITAGHDPDEARAIVETVAEAEDGDPLLARLELLWTRPAREGGEP